MFVFYCLWKEDRDALIKRSGEGSSIQKTKIFPHSAFLPLKNLRKTEYSEAPLFSDQKDPDVCKNIARGTTDPEIDSVTWIKQRGTTH